MMNIKKVKFFSILATCFLLFVFTLYGPVNSLAQTVSQYSFIPEGLMLRTPEFKKNQSVSLYLYGGQRPFEPGYIAGQIKATLKTDDKLRSTLEIRSSDNSLKNTGIKILPDGSVVMGGVSNNSLNPGPPVNDIPLDLPVDFENLSAGARANGIYDFFMSTPNDSPFSRPELFVRNIVVHDMGDPTELVLRRSQGLNPGDQVKYGEIQPVNVGEVLGNVRWEARGRDGFHPVTNIYAKNEAVAYGTESPGSLYFQTDGGKNDPGLKTRLTIKYNGNIGIGTGETNPQAKLHVFGNARIDSGLSIGQGCRGCADLAEDYPSKEKLEAGDLVIIDDQTSELSIKKSDQSYHHQLLGIVSSTPAIRISELGGVAISKGDNSESPDGYPVALTGRVPVKVSTENGEIRPGDFLTSSSNPGVAMKATSKGKVIGIALERYGSPGVGKIKVFVKATWYAP